MYEPMSVLTQVLPEVMRMGAAQVELMRIGSYPYIPLILASLALAFSVITLAVTIIHLDDPDDEKGKPSAKGDAPIIPWTGHQTDDPVKKVNRQAKLGRCSLHSHKAGLHPDDQEPDDQDRPSYPPIAF